MTAFSSKHFRLAARSLVRRPGGTVAAVLALGLGIGLVATLFSVVEGIFLRGLPFEDAHELVQVGTRNLEAGLQRTPPSSRDVVFLRRQATSFEGLAAWRGVGMTLSGGDAPAERGNGCWADPGLFAVVGVEPLLGRGLIAADAVAGAEPVVVISYELWHRLFAGDPEVLGRRLRLHGRPATVVGVMPAGFRFPLNQDFWLPLELDPAGAEPLYGLQMVARLRDGVGLAEAQAEVATLAAVLAQEHPETNRGVDVVVRPYVAAYSDAELRANLLALLAAVFAVLLVACANVATLLLARGAERAGELAVRTALGAGRLRLMGEVLAESLLLAALGGAVGVALAWVGSEVLDVQVQQRLASFWVDIRLDARVLAFAVGLTGASSLAAGLLPALRLTRPDLQRALKGGGVMGAPQGRGRLQRALVVAQVALCCALLGAAGLTVKSMVRIRAVDHGFDTENLLVAGVSLPAADFPDAGSRRLFAGELAARMESLPGVEAAGLGTGLPVGRGAATVVPAAVEGAPGGAAGEAVPVGWTAVSPGYFTALGVRPVAGRLFTATDRPGSLPVAVVGEGFARRFLGGAEPVGRRLRFRPEDPEQPWWTIVGVIPDLGSDQLPERARGFLPVIERSGPGEPAPPAVFVPMAQQSVAYMSLVVRTAGEPLALAPRLRRELAEVAPDLALVGVSTLERQIADITWDVRLFGGVLAVLAAVALGMAALGLYGVMAVAVEGRTREMGVRLALGADRAEVLRLIMGAGLRQMALGVGLGLALALGLARALPGLLLGVRPWDPWVLAAVVGVLVASGLAACWAPARRAARVEPAAALRWE